MKILFVDLKYEYGNPKRGINTGGELGFKKVFERLGHQVETFYYDDYLSKLVELQTALVERADTLKPDLIYFILFQNQFSLATLHTLKKKYITVNWFGDDHWRFDSFTTNYAPAFTWCVTTDMFALSRYKKLGIEKVFYSQWAATDLPDHTLPIKTEYKYDVSFIGGHHSTRGWIIDELKARGIDVNTFGFGWPNGILPLDEMIKLFQTSRINLNISNSRSLDLRYLLSKPKNIIDAYRSPKTASQIKSRNFEIPYYGGFQITDYVPTLEKYFDIGNEVICFSNFDEAALLIKYYLDNESEREAIKAKGIQRAQRHTFYHRHKDFFEHLIF